MGSGSLSESGKPLFLGRSSALAFLNRPNKRASMVFGGLDASFYQGQGRGERGIVCECCHHMCSYDELTEYCSVVRPKRFDPFLSHDPATSQTLERLPPAYSNAHNPAIEYAEGHQGQGHSEWAEPNT